MTLSKAFALEQVSDSACILNMPNITKSPGSVKKTITLPEEFSTDQFMINFDYDAAGKLLGIEVVCFD